VVDTFRAAVASPRGNRTLNSAGRAGPGRGLPV